MKKSSIIISGEDQRERAINIIQALDITKTMKVTIEKHVKKRSLSQSALYHKWVDILCDFTGYEKAEMKKELGERFMPPSGIRDGKDFDGNPKQFMSSAWLDKPDFTKYLESIDRFAVSYGVILPHPEDLQRHY